MTSFVLLLLSVVRVESLPVPSTADIVVYNLKPGALCITAREPDGSLCANAETPVALTGRQLDKLVTLLRSHTSYDRSAAPACFEPHHAVVFAYGTSSLDTYGVSLTCRSVEPGGSHPPCSDPKQCVDQERLSLTDAAYKQLVTLFRTVKVKGLPRK